MSRIDPKTNTVVATIEVGKQPSAIAISEGVAWVANFASHSVSRIDPRTNTIAATIKVGGSPHTIVARGTDVWAADRSGVVTRVDTKSNGIVAQSDVVFGLAGMAVTGNSLWVADYDRGRLMRIDLESNAFEGHVDVGKAPVILEEERIKRERSG